MIYEVEFTSISREAARSTARQLIEDHVLANASITPADCLFVDSQDNVAEQYVVKVKGLTTAADYLLEHYKLKNFVAKAATVDRETAKRVSSWCNEEDDVPERPERAWKDIRASILASAIDNGILEVTLSPSDEDLLTGHPQPITHHATATNLALDLANAMIEHGHYVETPSSETEELEETESDTEETDKKHKLPEWAEKQGLSYSEYKKLSNEKTAARWGITYQEYSRLAAEARKNNKTVKEYFEEQGLTYQKETETSPTESEAPEVIEFPDRKVDAQAFTQFPNVLAWAQPYGLTQKQLKLLTQPKNSKKTTEILPPWTKEIGMYTSQYGVISRIKSALSYGLTLADYDSYYTAAKKLDMTLNEYWQFAGKEMVNVEVTIKELCEQFMQAYNMDLQRANNSQTYHEDLF